MNPEELAIALRNADEAGDTAAAQTLADALRGVRQAQNEPPSGGSIFDPLAQGLSFGFSDEIAGGLGAGVNSVANLFGAGSGEPFGDAYRGIRDAARENSAAFAERNPVPALAAEVGGGLLTGGVGAARTGALQGGQALSRLSAQGAAQGGLYGAGASEAEDAAGLLGDAVTGAGLGATTGLLVPVAGRLAGAGLKRGTSGVNRLLGGGNNSVRTEAIKTLDEAGVPLTAGQRGGSKSVQARETDLSNVPVLGTPVAKTLENQQEAVQRRVLKMAGFADDDVAEGLVSAEAIDRARDRFTDRYTSALANTTIEVGEGFANALLAVQNRFSATLAGGRSKKIDNIVNDLFDRVTKDRLTGESYQRLRSELAEYARTSGKPRLQKIYNDLKQALDNEFLEAAPTATGKAKQQIDREYAQFAQVRDLVSRNAGGADGVVSGNLPIPALARLAQSRPGTDEWRKFLNSAAAIFPDRLPNSGTGGRNLTNAAGFGLLGIGSVGEPISALAAAMLARGTAGGLANPLGVQRGAQALGRGVDAAGVVGAPLLIGADQVPVSRSQGIL